MLVLKLSQDGTIDLVSEILLPSYETVSPACSSIKLLKVPIQSNNFLFLACDKKSWLVTLEMFKKKLLLK